MPLATRQELVQLARKHDALIICDDVYDFVFWDAETSPPGQGKVLDKTTKAQPFLGVLPRLVDIDRTLEPVPGTSSFGNVLSNGSFSKIVAPGVRTGWVQSSTMHLAQSISQAGVTRSGGAASNLTGTILAHALRTGAIESHMRQNLIPSYSRRWRILVSSVKRELGPLGVKVAGGNGHTVDSRTIHLAAAAEGGGELPKLVAGGFFIWLALPAGLTDGVVAARLLSDANVAVATETQCRLPHQGQATKREGNNIRLCFAYEDEEKLAEGVERIREVLEVLLNEAKDGRIGFKETGPNVSDYA
jgi:DNA-binding transcriptional MocR family regulator